MTQINNELDVMAPSKSRDERPTRERVVEMKDELIEAQVRASMLEQLGADALDVDVSVEGGQVELSGTLPRSDLRQYVLSIVQGVSGVQGITDKLDIQS